MVEGKGGGVAVEFNCKICCADVSLESKFIRLTMPESSTVDSFAVEVALMLLVAVDVVLSVEVDDGGDRTVVSGARSK